MGIEDIDQLMPDAEPVEDPDEFESETDGSDDAFATYPQLDPSDPDPRH